MAAPVTAQSSAGGAGSAPGASAPPSLGTQGVVDRYRPRSGPKPEAARYGSYSHGPSYWWWPSNCYLPSYLQADAAPAVVGGRAPAAAAPGAARPAARQMKPAELTDKCVDLGDFYFRDGRFADAAAAYAHARTCAPGDASLHFVLADAVFATGDYHFAAYLIGEAVRLDPAIANAETDKRLQYGDVKLFEQQMQTLMRYVQEKPYDVMALLVLGYNLKFSGKPQDAAKAFARVLEIDPASVAARRFADSLAPKPPAPPPAEASKSDKPGDKQ